MANRMKAMVLPEFGEPELFRLAEVPIPDLLPGHIRIRPAATSVNPIDCRIRAGLMPQVAPNLPAILHGDVAGTVEAVGKGVTRFQPGDEVFALAGGVRGFDGALAEQMLVDELLAAKKPPGLSMAEAAALPIVGLTAWNALFERARIRAGQRVLVHAAAGGVGHIAIQLARWAGADVYATASTQEKLKLAESLGATPIPYRERTVQEYVDQYTLGDGFDLVLDTVGKDNLDRSFEAVRSGGTVVSISTRSQHDLSIVHAKGLTLHVEFTLLPLLTGQRREHQGLALGKMAGLAEQGHLRPVLDEIYPFTDAASAHRRLESGKNIGKVVLQSDLIC